MVKVVLDTNVLVSSLLASGPPAVITDLIADDKIIPFYCDLILQEYWDVLSREKFGFNSLRVNCLINDIVRTGIVVAGNQSSKIKMADEDDRVFYDTALDAQAYLITGNSRHFPTKPFIVSPAKFLTFYREKII